MNRAQHPSTAALRRLLMLLAADAVWRIKPPISLPGRPAPPPQLPQPPPPPAVGRVQWSPWSEGTSRLANKFDPNDAALPYSRGQLLEMNARFVRRVESAFASGNESRAAAMRKCGCRDNCPGT